MKQYLLNTMEESHTWANSGGHYMCMILHKIKPTKLPAGNGEWDQEDPLLSEDYWKRVAAKGRWVGNAVLERLPML